jgi:SAM-dependent methyltransferase
MPAIHQAAASGFAAKSATYDAGRPEYPAAVAGWLTHDLGLAPGRRALDLGAGTGKFTGRLVDTGAEVLAVEPVEAMRARLAASQPSVTTLAGTAEAIPLEDASIDAVVCAQAFHWFANAAALAEIRRVLRPGGRLGLIWNVRDERTPWVAELTRIMNAYEGDAPRYHTGAWRRLFPADGFGPLQQRSFPHGATGPAERVIVDRVMSVSFIGALAPDEQAQVADAVRAVIAGTPDLADRSEVTFPYETAAFVAEKMPG